MRLDERVGVLALRGGQMGVTLLVMQLTFLLYPADAFLYYNQLLFAVALHTCLTYGVQVGIWNGGAPAWSRLALQGGLGAVAVAAALSLYAGASWSLLAGSLVYLLARFADRLYFNATLTLQAPVRAYAGAIAVAALELLTLLAVLVVVADWPVLRVLLPALLMLPLALALAGRALLALRATAASAAAPVPTRGFAALAPALHAFCLLAVAMSDRVLVEHVALPASDKALYLLQFAYAGAFYTLLVSLFEVRRPALFACARETPAVLVYLQASGGPRFFALAAGAGIVVALAGGVGFAVARPAAAFAAGLGWAMLVLYFVLLVALAYVQGFFLARQAYAPLFAGWGLAFAVKLAAVATGSVQGLLAGNVLAVAAALALALMAGGRRADAD